MRFDKVGVVGAGIIGRGVAQALAQTGHNVVLIDISLQVLAAARETITNGLRLAAFSNPALRKVDHAQILRRVSFTPDFKDLADTKFIIENATEAWDVKSAVYQTLDSIAPVDCVFAVNTSAFQVERVATVATRHPHIVGIHFMNPVPQKRFVEMIVGEATTEFAVEAAHVLIAQLEKEAIVVGDTPGFVSNRVMMLMINEAIAVLDDGTANALNIDAVFVKCFGHAMGPLATADLIGLDTVLLTLDVLRDSFGDPKFEASPLLRRMVEDGRLGRKAGVGFFEYVKRNGPHHG